MNRSTTFLVLLALCVKMHAQQPFFETGQDPNASTDKTWTKVDNLSDEFEGTALDETKWMNTDPAAWIGRAPALFVKDVVSVSDDNLKITNYQFSSPRVVNGETFTHGAGNIWSMNRAEVGQYFEVRMKANKTFLSSTFWLINRTKEFTGCDKRTTELDIQECVGEITGGGSSSFDRTIHSNTHSRNTSCMQTPTGSQGDNAQLASGKVWEDYHVYGAWWKSPTEVLFFLDGKEVYSITPKSEFNLPMYLRLVTEAYNWNPVPADGGMTGSEEERTTFYDWVRTWKLVDKSTLSTENVSTLQYKFYPNPSSKGVLTVEIPNHKSSSSTQIKIFNTAGQLVNVKESSLGTTIVHTDKLSTGIYVMEISTDGLKQVEKIVIQ